MLKALKDIYFKEIKEMKVSRQDERAWTEGDRNRVREKENIKRKIP